MNGVEVTVTPLGDSAVLAELSGRDPELLYAIARSTADSLSRAQIRGVLDVSVAYATIAVYFDPLVADASALAAEARSLAGERPTDVRDEPAEHAIAVSYGGPDLEEVARRTGLLEREVVAIHAERVYVVRAVGFAPGFAYLADLDSRLWLPRREAPRPRVPRGSVAIAERHTAVYPADTPGGWHIIGSTDVTMFDPAADPPSLLRVGDRVRFFPK